MASIFLKNETTIRKFEINELLYINCEDHCLSFHTADSVFHTTGNLGEVAKTLPYYFVLINRSMIINLKHIKEIKLSQRILICQNGIEHIISHRRLSSLVKAIRFPNSKVSIHTFDDDFYTFTKND